MAGTISSDRILENQKDFPDFSGSSQSVHRLLIQVYDVSMGKEPSAFAITIL
jgi:hypothetical protein